MLYIPPHPPPPSIYQANVCAKTNAMTRTLTALFDAVLWEKLAPKSREEV